MNELEEVRGRVRQLRVIWFALLLSVAVFTGVVWFLLKAGALAAAETFSPTVLAYAAIAVALGLLVAPVVRRRIEATPPTATRSQVAGRWQAGWLIGQAVKEGVGLAGLVIAMLAGSAAWALGFAAASIGSMLLTPPWEHDLLKRLRNAPADVPGESA